MCIQTHIRSSKEKDWWFSFFLALTIALIDTLSDRTDKVRDSVAQSIVDTGKKLPQSTVKLCTNYLDKHPKSPDTHRAAILRVIQRILNYHLDREGKIPFDNETFQFLTRVSITELTMPKVCLSIWIIRFSHLCIIT